MAACLDALHADRIGHGIRAAEDPALVKRLAADGITCEVCPSSNVALGVAAAPAQVPLRRLFEAGVPVALGADDPLLFGPRLTAQYEIARHAHGFTDAELADLARASVLGSAAPEALRAELLTGIGVAHPRPAHPRRSTPPWPGDAPGPFGRNDLDRRLSFAEYSRQQISFTVMAMIRLSPGSPRKKGPARPD